MTRLRILIITACLAAAGPARADDAVATYAIVVGSNAGGPGQTDLRYSEDDARRVGSLLTELGGYKPDQVDVVVHPTPDVLRDRLAKLGERVTADLAAGRQSRVFFYYSGHARAAAIDLGIEELPLAELRQRLFQVPATLTVVVLDACQSGAFSRVKGAQPAADFSYNSRQHLDATGIAVLASSSGSELSQESEQLRSSYFTHHLLVGLRGAGDANRDGQVSIDEAYRYAYHQTLLATAETAVGGQHVTLEVDLKGHGDVAMSFPRAATQTIELPATLEGKTLVEDKRSHTVVAETYKARGAPVRIAVAPGEYQVLVRHGSSLSRCEVAGGGVVDLEHCSTEAIVVATSTKGPGIRNLRFELMAMAGLERHDGYTDTLEAFRYVEDGTSSGMSLRAYNQIDRHFWVGALAGYENLPHWERQSNGLPFPLRFDWSMYTVAAIGRGEIAAADSGFLSHIHFYAQMTAGLGIGRTQFRDQNDMSTSQTFFGPALSAGAGMLALSAVVPGLGIGLGYELDYAHVIDNLAGDTHESGGHRLSLSVSYSFGVSR
jgi:hypothetical protein